MNSRVRVLDLMNSSSLWSHRARAEEAPSHAAHDGRQVLGDLAQQQMGVPRMDVRQVGQMASCRLVRSHPRHYYPLRRWERNRGSGQANPMIAVYAQRTSPTETSWSL